MTAPVELKFEKKKKKIQHGWNFPVYISSGFRFVSENYKNVLRCIFTSVIFLLSGVKLPPCPTHDTDKTPTPSLPLERFGHPLCFQASFHIHFVSPFTSPVLVAPGSAAHHICFSLTRVRQPKFPTRNEVQ